MSGKLQLAIKLANLRRQKAQMRVMRLYESVSKAVDLTRQLSNYADEYQKRWFNVAKTGGKVDQLRSEAAFSNQLRATATEQGVKASLAERAARSAEENLAREIERLSLLQEKERSMVRLAQQRRERLEESESERRTDNG